jgi:hypothetical protein
LQDFWREFKKQELESIQKMKEFLAEELKEECQSCG